MTVHDAASPGNTAELTPRSPALLVQTFVFSQDRLLLMQRGVPPYAGKWAPPGGFVEPYESAEAAALREIREEVGLQLAVEQLIPLAVASIECINQVCIMFIAHLERPLPLFPQPPEALDARWFHASSFPLSDVWEPIAHVDMSDLFERVRAGRFEFYQRTDDFHRVISDRGVRYLRRGPARR